MSVPKFEVPNVDTSSLPKVDTTKMAIPSFGGISGGSDENKEPLEAQEIRDEKAVDAKKKFVDLDLKAQVRHVYPILLVDRTDIWTLVSCVLSFLCLILIGN